MSVLGRYMLREMTGPFVIGIAFLTFVFLMTRILEITNWIVNYKISLLKVLLLVLFYIPFFIVFIIPMALMVAILLTLLRMNRDNEITALKSCGSSVRRLVLPVGAFCLIGFVLTAVAAAYGVPWGMQSIKQNLPRMAASNLSTLIKERTFNKAFKDIVLYINRIDVRTNELVDVFVAEGRFSGSGSTIVAPRGRLFADVATTTFHLQLYDGFINQADARSQKARMAHFDSLEINLDLGDEYAALKKRAKLEREMYPMELWRYLQALPHDHPRYYLGFMELHKKFSIPFACLTMGMMALPLGVMFRGARITAGLGLGLLFFLLYYILFAAGMAFGENGTLAPATAMWLPNLFALIVTAWLMRLALRDRQMRFFR